MAIIQQFSAIDQENSSVSQALAIEQTSKRLVSLLPALGGILITRMLGVSGWRAIGAYVVSTEALHVLLASLKSESSQTSQSSNSSPQKVVSRSSVSPSANINYRVAHQASGRIRLIVPKITKDPDYAKRLQRLAAATEEIKEMRVHLGSASVIVTYEAKQIDRKTMLSRLEKLLEAALETEEINNDNNGNETKIPEPETLAVPQTSETLSPEEEIPKAASQNTEVVSEPAPAQMKKNIPETELSIKNRENNVSYNFSRQNLFNWSEFRASSLATMLNLMSNLPVRNLRRFIY